MLMLSVPPRAVIWKAIAIRSPFAMVFVPAVMADVTQPTAIPPPPPTGAAFTSKVITSATLTARAGGPAAVSTAAIPILTVVAALTKVAATQRQLIADGPVVSIV